VRFSELEMRFWVTKHTLSLLAHDVRRLEMIIDDHRLVCPEGTVQSGLTRWQQPFPGTDTWFPPRKEEDLVDHGDHVRT